MNILTEPRILRGLEDNFISLLHILWLAQAEALLERKLQAKQGGESGRVGDRPLARSESRRRESALNVVQACEKILQGHPHEEKADKALGQPCVERAVEEPGAGTERRVRREEVGIWEDVGEELQDDQRLRDPDGVTGERVSRLQLGSAVDEVGDLARERSMDAGMGGGARVRLTLPPSVLTFCAYHSGLSTRSIQMTS